MPQPAADITAEKTRLQEAHDRQRSWKRWGPFLSERQWGTVREDYSDNGDCWSYFPHDRARSRAYRWGEDGLMGISDRQGRLCFALGLWNGKDPILKERLFGVNGHEGNHGEDVKEEYFYLDSTPTHSWMRGLYKYPQGEYPYSDLIEENCRRGHGDPEYELADTGVFRMERYFDAEVRYAKCKPNDMLIEIEVSNRGDKEAQLHLLPTLWFRNTWSWGQRREDSIKPECRYGGKNRVETRHATMGRFFFDAEPLSGEARVPVIFTENETRPEGHVYPFEKKVSKGKQSDMAKAKEDLEPLKAVEEVDEEHHYYKDAFHHYIVGGHDEAVQPNRQGTKCAYVYRLSLKGGESRTVRLRLVSDNDKPLQSFGEEFSTMMARRREEADAYYDSIIPAHLGEDDRRILRQAYAGLLWTKQFYHYIVRDWLRGDRGHKSPEHRCRHGRNHDWDHLYNRDIISMPDKWEYPWYAAWDLAFHMIPFSRIDQGFAEGQLSLFLEETYMHPNGQIPAYEFAFGDVNPPVHAWACWRIYKSSGVKGERNREFLAESFQKLLLNFTWWVNRKDVDGKNLFSGGFLGLDNITLFDRSNMPPGCQIVQADGTAWMAFFCATMLRMALELASENRVYEGMAVKFFKHFLSIAQSMNSDGLWDEENGFYYDQVIVDGYKVPLKVRSMVGVIPLFAATILKEEVIMELSRFEEGMNWTLEEFSDLSKHISWMEAMGEVDHHSYLLAIPSKRRLKRVLAYLLDEEEFLSPYGIRSLSKVHAKHPVSFKHDGQEYKVSYDPAESTSGLFGGNSNWRGPIWFPLNHLLIESLWRYYDFYGDSFKVECPVGSGQVMNLKEVACEISRRLIKIFQEDKKGQRPCNGKARGHASSEHWKDNIPFHEYFNGETGQGLGASHQTGWTALVISCFDTLERLEK